MFLSITTEAGVKEINVYELQTYKSIDDDSGKYIYYIMMNGITFKEYFDNDTDRNAKLSILENLNPGGGGGGSTYTAGANIDITGDVISATGLVQEEADNGDFHSSLHNSGDGLWFNATAPDNESVNDTTFLTDSVIIASTSDTDDYGYIDTYFGLNSGAGNASASMGVSTAGDNPVDGYSEIYSSSTDKESSVVAHSGAINLLSNNYENNTEVSMELNSGTGTINVSAPNGIYVPSSIDPELDATYRGLSTEAQINTLFLPDFEDQIVSDDLPLPYLDFRPEFINFYSTFDDLPEWVTEYVPSHYDDDSFFSNFEDPSLNPFGEYAKAIITRSGELGEPVTVNIVLPDGTYISDTVTFRYDEYDENVGYFEHSSPLVDAAGREWAFTGKVFFETDAETGDSFVIFQFGPSNEMEI